MDWFNYNLHEPKHQTSKYNTVIIAIGSGQWSYKNVLDFIFSEIKSLWTPKQRYCSSTKTFVLSCFGFIVYIADRPKWDLIIDNLSIQPENIQSDQNTPHSLTQHMLSCGMWLWHSVNCCINDISQLCNCNCCIAWNFYNMQKTTNYHSCPKKYPQYLSSGLPMPEKRTISETHVVPHQMIFGWMSKELRLAEAELSSDTFFVEMPKFTLNLWVSMMQ